MKHKIIIGLGSLIAAFSLSAIPNLNEPPKKPVAPVTKRTEFQASRDNIEAKDELCFDPRRDFGNADLNHLCRGVK